MIKWQWLQYRYLLSYLRSSFLVFAVVLITFCGGSYVGVVQSRSGKMPVEVDFLAALLPLVCIPAVFSLACGLYKWWVFIIFLSCLYSGIYQIVFLSIVRLCAWPVKLVVTFYSEDIFVLMIGRMLELPGRMMGGNLQEVSSCLLSLGLFFCWVQSLQLLPPSIHGW